MTCEVRRVTFGSQGEDTRACAPASKAPGPAGRAGHRGPRHSEPRAPPRAAGVARLPCARREPGAARTRGLSRSERRAAATGAGFRSPAARGRADTQCRRTSPRESGSHSHTVTHHTVIPPGELPHLLLGDSEPGGVVQGASEVAGSVAELYCSGVAGMCYQWISHTETLRIKNATLKKKRAGYRDVRHSRRKVGPARRKPSTDTA